MEGKSKIIIEYKSWKICPLICYDLRFPVWSRNSEGYDLLIYVANWPASRSYAWDTLLRARAIENQSYVAAVNRIGKDGEGIEYSGESVILDPKGMPLHEVIKGKQAIFSKVLDLEELRTFRKKFPVADDADRYKLLI
jgi:predicted amidohydrolase